MPNRKEHEKITYFVAMASIGSGAILGFQPALIMTLGVLSTLPYSVFGSRIYLNPDMDIYKSNKKGISSLVGGDIYSQEIKHRAGLRRKDWEGIWRYPLRVFTFSHIPLLGTLPRSLPVFVLLAILSPMIDGFLYIYLWWLAGMVLSDAAHVLADLTTSEFKSGRGYG